MKLKIHEQLLFKIRELRNNLALLDNDTLPESSIVFMKAISNASELQPNGINAAKMSDIKRICGFHKTKMAKISAKLVERGYIIKMDAEFDRRAKYAALTQAGQALLEKEVKSVYGVADSLISKLGDKETIHLISLLDTLSEVLTSTEKITK